MSHNPKPKRKRYSNINPKTITNNKLGFFFINQAKKIKKNPHRYLFFLFFYSFPLLFYLFPISASNFLISYQARRRGEPTGVFWLEAMTSCTYNWLCCCCCCWGYWGPITNGPPTQPPEAEEGWWWSPPGSPLS